MHTEFEKALFDLVSPGLRLLGERPWRLPFTHGTEIAAPTLFKEEATALVNPNEPELLLIIGEDPAIRLFYRRVKEIPKVHRRIYESRFGPEEIVPLPGRVDEEGHVPLLARHVAHLVLCTKALAEFFHAHRDRVDKENYEVTESRIVRGHAMKLEFPSFTMAEGECACCAMERSYNKN